MSRPSVAIRKGRQVGRTGLFSAHSSSVWLKSRRTASVWSGANVAQVSQSLNRTAVGDGARVAGAHSSSVWLSVIVGPSGCASDLGGRQNARVPNGAQSVEAHCCSGLSVVQQDGSGGVGDGRQMSKDVRRAQCSVVKPVRSPSGDLGGLQKGTHGSEVAQGCSGCFKPNSGRS